MSHEQEDHVEHAEHVDEVKAEDTQTTFWTTERVCVGLILAGFVLVLAFLYRDNTHLQTRLHETEQAAIGAKARLAQITTQGIPSDNQPGTPPAATPTTSLSPDEPSEAEKQKKEKEEKEKQEKEREKQEKEREKERQEKQYASSEDWHKAYKEPVVENDPISQRVAAIIKEMDAETNEYITSPQSTEAIKTPVYFEKNFKMNRIYVTKKSDDEYIVNLKFHMAMNHLAWGALEPFVTTHFAYVVQGKATPKLNNGATSTGITEGKPIEGLAQRIFTDPELKKVTHLRLISEDDTTDKYGEVSTYLHGIVYMSRKEIEKIKDWKVINMHQFTYPEYYYNLALLKKAAADN